MSEYTNTLTTASGLALVAIAKEPVTGPTLLEATYGGTVTFHKQRGNGTFRSWPVLAPGTKERKQAEAWKASKQPVPALAKASHTSVPTVRRALVALAFTEELEGMAAKGRTALAKEANANLEVAKANKPEPAPKEQPKAKATTAKAEPKAPVGTQAKAKAHAAKMRKTASTTVKQGRKAGAAKASTK